MCHQINSERKEGKLVGLCAYSRENVFTVCMVDVCYQCETTIQQEWDGWKKKQLSCRAQTLMKLIYYLPVQLPCTIQGAWQFPVPLQLRDICPFSKLADTNRIWPCRQIKATSGEMRAVASARKSQRGGIDYPLCLKTWPKHLAQGLFISWSWKTPSGGIRRYNHSQL